MSLSFCWFTACWMSAFLLVREYEVRQRAVGHLLEDFPAFLGPHSHMIVYKLLAIQHLEGFHPQIVPHTGCSGQGSAASAMISSQLFSRVFEELREADTRFSSAPCRSRVFPVSWNFFTIFYTVDWLIFSRFTISTLLFHFCEA